MLAPFAPPPPPNLPIGATPLPVPAPGRPEDDPPAPVDGLSAEPIDSEAPSAGPADGVSTDPPLVKVLLKLDIAVIAAGRGVSAVWRDSSELRRRTTVTLERGAVLCEAGAHLAKEVLVCAQAACLRLAADKAMRV